MEIVAIKNKKACLNVFNTIFFLILWLSVQVVYKMDSKPFFVGKYLVGNI
ncbi:hypothetical protein BXY_41400 [Bacteroides xylanisolvens XB1A]|uniref:Uncharacterized protein n=1 Tax=Bacteroides xylanisolvens XB1A TaxID=657309 RepID=D6D3P9_9BACE|nr:hypothetical protein BXY_41400 [Bacteroides xylanisolvens XB1A]